MTSTSTQSITLLKEVFKSGQLARGRLVKQAETELKKILNHSHLVLTSSGTGGIHAGLLALGLSPGDEVITTGYTFASPLNTILTCGAKPVLVDLDQNYRLKISQLKKALTPKTKGILAVDMFGIVNDYQFLTTFTKQHGLWLLSDSCQSLGNKTSNLKSTQLHCDILVSSFFDTKNISTGEGGVVLTRNQKLLDLVHMYISHGQPMGVQYDYKVVGLNYRPTELQSAILLPKLIDWESDKKLRQKQVTLYSAGLSKVSSLIKLPKISCEEIASGYPIQVPPSHQSALEKFLQKQCLPYKRHYPKSLHQYPLYKSLVRCPVSLINSELFGKTTIILPIGAKTNNKTIIQTINAINQYFQQI